MNILCQSDGSFPQGRALFSGQIDIARPMAVQVQADHRRKVLHVNVNGVCLLRASQIKNLSVEELINNGTDLDVELKKAGLALKIATLSELVNTLLAGTPELHVGDPSYFNGYAAGYDLAVGTLQDQIDTLTRELDAC